MTSPAFECVHSELLTLVKSYYYESNNKQEISSNGKYMHFLKIVGVDTSMTLT